MINYYGTIYHIGGTGYHYVGKVKYCERTENKKKTGLGQLRGTVKIQWCIRIGPCPLLMKV